MKKRKGLRIFLIIMVVILSLLMLASIWAATFVWLFNGPNVQSASKQIDSKWESTDGKMHIEIYDTKQDYQGAVELISNDETVHTFYWREFPHDCSVILYDKDNMLPCETFKVKFAVGFNKFKLIAEQSDFYESGEVIVVRRTQKGSMSEQTLRSIVIYTIFSTFFISIALLCLAGVIVTIIMFIKITKKNKFSNRGI